MNSLRTPFALGWAALVSTALGSLLLPVPAVFAQSAGDFRSAASGSWGAGATWETYDGANWVAASAAPGASDGAITVRAGHTVTLAAAATYDQLTVEAGAQVTVSSGVASTLANGAGTDLVVLGTWLNAGDTWTVTDASWSVGAGGTYVHATTADVAGPLAAATLDPASTFVYRGSDTLTPAVAFSAVAYGHLVLESTSGAWTAAASGGGALAVAGDFTIGAGVTFANALTAAASCGDDLSCDGVMTYGAGTQAWDFSGAAATVGGAGTIEFEDLGLGPGAALTLAADVAVQGVLALGAQQLATGAHTLTLGAGGSISRTSGWVNGRLARTIPTGASSPTFDIGDGTAYAPVELALTGVTTGGTLTASTTAGLQPDAATSTLDPALRVNRYWTLTNGSVVPGSVDATFHFSAGEVLGGANADSLRVGQHGGSGWTYPALGTRTATATQATGLTSFGDFMLAETQYRTITATAGANGSVAPSGAVPVVMGTDRTFVITPDPGYSVLDVLVDGVTAGAVTAYTFTNVVTTHTIAASFTPTLPPAVIDAGSPAGTVSPATPSLTVPVTITRSYPNSNRLFHVVLQLGGGLTLTGGTAGITEGGYLASGGGTTDFHVVDNGAGSYAVDGTILGTPCINTALTGTLFNVAVGSAAAGGTGTVTLTATELRDCDNNSLPSSIGTAAAVAIDNEAPAVTLTAPNGGEFWVAGSTHDVTWTATDNVGVIAVDLAYSTDGGASYPNAIATGLANTGTHAWTLPPALGTQVRVSATVRDAGANSDADSSDADFTIGQWTLTASAGAHGSIAPSGVVSVNQGDSQAFTITADAGWHVDDVLVDALSVGRVTSYTFTNVSANHTIGASFAVNPPTPPITELAATQVKTGNDADGTTRVAVSWPAVATGSNVAVYRAPYGNYPEYDDAPGAGSVPALPTYPPSSPWQLTSITTSGQTDERSTRDCWYFVAFVTDSFGTVSPVSNLSGGALNYHLGDVTDGVTPGLGNNLVDISDVSLLGAHYGLTGAAVTPYGYLDVGPTTNRNVDGRPMTDNQIDFEDLVMFAINYMGVGAPQLASRPLAAGACDELRLDVPADFGDEGVLTARLELRGSGNVLGLSARLGWDPAVASLESSAPGELADAQGAVLLSGRAGTIDVVALGRSGGLAGTGTIAAVTFRRIGQGDPRITLESVDARDAANGAAALTFGTRPAPEVPAVTSFSRVAPNPFRSGGALSFGLALGGDVELSLYSVDGRRVRRLVHGTREAGVHHVTWDGRDDNGAPAAAGVYYAKLVTRQGSFQRSFVLLR